MEINITLDELIEEQLKYANVEPEPSPNEGWAAFTETVKKIPDKSQKENVRTKFNKLVAKGEMEKRYWKGQVYYRIVAQ